MPVGGSNGVEMKTICFEKVKEPSLLALERDAKITRECSNRGHHGDKH